MALYTAEIERQWIFAISSLFLSLLHLEEQWNIPRYTCVPLSIPKCLPIFSKFFRINGKKENLNSRNTYLEIFVFHTNYSFQTKDEIISLFLPSIFLRPRLEPNFKHGRDLEEFPKSIFLRAKMSSKILLPAGYSPGQDETSLERS